METIQALLFNKKSFTLKSANKWIKEHNYKPIKNVHETKGFWRYRLTKPSKTAIYRMIKFGKGIMAVYDVSEAKKIKKPSKRLKKKITIYT